MTIKNPKLTARGKVNPRNCSNGSPDYGGRPTYTEGELREKYNEYINWIVDHDYSEPPSITGFARRLKRNPSTISKYLNMYPKLKEDVKEGFADVLSDGAMLGKYRDASAIFTLKNRCGWTDKRESTNVSVNKEVATEEEARKKVLELVRNEKTG